MINLNEIFKKYGFDLSEKQIDQFEKYYNFLISENKKYNLTAITSYDDVVIKHFLDSVLVSKYFDFSSVITVCDIGTGAGFPLVPLKIVYPHLEIYLLDSLNKRVKFLKELISILSLDKSFAIHSRAEDFGRSDKRESFDLTINRAVASISVLSEYCLPLNKVGGGMLVLKSLDFKDDLNKAQEALKKLNSKIIEVHEDIELEDNKRTYIYIKKLASSSLKYPRKAGTPNKKPL